jgi:hypothetical protein
MRNKINEILEKELKGFYYRISEFEFLGHKLLRVTIAASEKTINNVNGEYPQKVVLQLDLGTLELNCYQHIYRNPEPNENLVMRALKVPFRTPDRNEKAILACIQRFVIRYKYILKSNIDVLRYQDLADYKKILNETEA